MGRFTGNLNRVLAPIGDTKQKGSRMAPLLLGTRNGNRTHNCPLGGGCYIHLTMQAYSIRVGSP